MLHFGVIVPFLLCIVEKKSFIYKLNGGILIEDETKKDCEL